MPTIRLEAATQTIIAETIWTQTLKTRKTKTRSNLKFLAQAIRNMTHQTDFDTTKLLFSTGKRMRIFTWHIHGSYLFYLSQGNYDIFIPVNDQKSDRYCGRGNTFPFGSNVIEVKAEEVKNLEFDVLLFQADENYFIDQYEILSEEQRALPKIYLEHDPPWGHPTNEVHPVKNNDVTLVHVTHFNK